MSTAAQRRELPIIFRAEMVRAILDGRKSQTRRIIKPQPPEYFDTPVFDRTGLGWFYDNLDSSGDANGVWPDNDLGISCPYGQPGDLLYVREAWRICDHDFGTPPCSWLIGYCATPCPNGVNSEHSDWASPPDDERERWAKRFGAVNGEYEPSTKRDVFRKRPSIHMPKWAARIWLEVTKVRVESVQDISEADARAEGVDLGYRCPQCGYTDYDARSQMDHRLCGEPPPLIGAFRELWDSIHGEGAWDRNDWVWVVEFKRRERP